MRVLWLCNIMLPFIAKSLGQKIVIREDGFLVLQKN